MSLSGDNSDRMIPIIGLKNAIGLDFDFSERRLYWTDVTDDSLSRISVDGLGYEKIINPGEEGKNFVKWNVKSSLCKGFTRK